MRLLRRVDRVDASRDVYDLPTPNHKLKFPVSQFRLLIAMYVHDFILVVVAPAYPPFPVWLANLLVVLFIVVVVVVTLSLAVRWATGKHDGAGHTGLWSCPSSDCGADMVCSVSREPSPVSIIVTTAAVAEQRRRWVRQRRFYGG